jgi:hypothetical protein
MRNCQQADSQDLLTNRCGERDLQQPTVQINHKDSEKNDPGFL